MHVASQRMSQGIHINFRRRNDGMKVIFLDIDGVLNSMDWFEKTKGTKGYREINPKKVEFLKEIVDKTNAKIVLSSTWRGLAKSETEEEHPMYSYLVDTLRKYGMEIFQHTPYINQERPKEIKAWIEKNKERIGQFVSLDDDFSEEDYKEYGIEKFLVKTSFYEKDGGLRQEHVEKAIEILNK